MKETLHFNELARRIPNCTRRMLALQLKELVDAQIVARAVSADRSPVQVAYQLTALGESLLPIVWAMNDWGSAYIREITNVDTLEESCQG